MIILLGVIAKAMVTFQLAQNTDERDLTTIYMTRLDAGTKFTRNCLRKNSGIVQTLVLVQ